MILYIVLFGLALYILYHANAFSQGIAWLLLRFFRIEIKLPVYETRFVWRDLLLLHQNGDWHLALHRIHVLRWNTLKLEGLVIKINEKHRMKKHKKEKKPAPHRKTMPHAIRIGALWMLQKLLAWLHFSISLDALSLYYTRLASHHNEDADSFSVKVVEPSFNHRGATTVCQMQSMSLTRSSAQVPMVTLERTLSLRRQGSELIVHVGGIQVHAPLTELQRLFTPDPETQLHPTPTTASIPSTLASAPSPAIPKSDPSLLSQMLAAMRVSFKFGTMSLALLDDYIYRIQDLSFGFTMGLGMILSFSCQPCTLDYEKLSAQSTAVPQEQFRLTSPTVTWHSTHSGPPAESVLEMGPWTLSSRTHQSGNMEDSKSTTKDKDETEATEDVLLRIPTLHLQFNGRSPSLRLDEPILVVFDYFHVRLLLEPIVKMLEMMREHKMLSVRATRNDTMESILSEQMKWLYGIQPAQTLAVPALSGTLDLVCRLACVRLVYRVPVLCKVTVESKSNLDNEADIENESNLDNVAFQFDQVELAQGKLTVSQVAVTTQASPCQSVWPWMKLCRLTWQKQDRAESVNEHLYESMLAPSSERETLIWHESCQYSLAIDDWLINFHLASPMYELIEGVIVPLKSLVKWIKGPVDAIEDWNDLYLLPPKLLSSLTLSICQFECKWSEAQSMAAGHERSPLSATTLARLSRVRRQYERDRRVREALFWRLADHLCQSAEKGPNQEQESNLDNLYQRYLEAESLIYCRLYQMAEKRGSMSESQCLIRFSLTKLHCALLPFLPMLSHQAPNHLRVNEDWVSALSFALYGRDASAKDTIDDFETMKNVTVAVSFTSLSFRLLESSPESLLYSSGVTRLVGPIWIVELSRTPECTGLVRLHRDRRSGGAPGIDCPTTCQPVYLVHQLQLSMPHVSMSMSSLADLPVLMQWAHGWLEHVTRPVTQALTASQRLRPLLPLDKLRWLVRGLPSLNHGERRWCLRFGHWSLRLKNGQDWIALQSHRHQSERDPTQSAAAAAVVIADDELPWLSTAIEPWRPLSGHADSPSSTNFIVLSQHGTLSLRASLAELSAYQSNEALLPFRLYDLGKDELTSEGLLLVEWQSFRIKLEMQWHPTQGPDIRNLHIKTPSHTPFSEDGLYDPFAEIASPGLAMHMDVESSSGSFYLNDWPEAWSSLRARVLPPRPLLALIMRDPKDARVAKRTAPLLQSVRLSCPTLPAMHLRMLRLKSETEWIGFLAHIQNATVADCQGHLHWHWSHEGGTSVLDLELAETVIGSLIPYRSKDGEAQGSHRRHGSEAMPRHELESEQEEWQWLDENFEREMKQLVLMIPGIECQLFAMVPSISFIQTGKEMEPSERAQKPGLDLKALRVQMYERLWNAACDALSALDPIHAVAEFRLLKKDIRALESKLQLLQSCEARALIVDELKLKWHQHDRRIVFQFWDWLSSHNELRGLRARIKAEGGLESLLARALSKAQRQEQDASEAEEHVHLGQSPSLDDEGRKEKNAEMVDYIIRKLTGSAFGSEQRPSSVRNGSISPLSLSLSPSLSTSPPSTVLASPSSSLSTTGDKAGLALANTWTVFFEFPQVLFQSPRPCLSGSGSKQTQGALILVAERASLKVSDWATKEQVQSQKEHELAGSDDTELPICCKQIHFTFEGAELYAQYRCDWQQTFRALWKSTLLLGPVGGGTGPFLCSWPAFLLNSDLESQYEPEQSDRHRANSESDTPVPPDWRHYFERIIERTKLLVYYETMDKRSATTADASSTSGSDALRIIFPYPIKFSTNSPAYCLLYDTIAALFVYSDPERKTRSTLLDRLTFEWRLASPTTLPSSLKERMKRMRATLAKYIAPPQSSLADTSPSLKWAQFLDYLKQVWQAHQRIVRLWRACESQTAAIGMNKSNEKVKHGWMADVRHLRQELLLLWLMLQDCQALSVMTNATRTEKLPGVQVRLQCPSGEWTLLGPGNSPMLRLNMETLAVDYHHYEDGTKATTAQLASTSIVNLVRGAYYRNFLRPLATPSPPPPSSSPAAASTTGSEASGRKREGGLPHMWFYWRELAPVAGIAVLERVELWVGPTEWNLSHDIDKRMIEFLFPLLNTSNRSNEDPKRPEDRTESDAKSREEERQADKTQAQATSDKSDDENVELELMKERASSRRSFVTILVPSATHLISYKGRNEKARNIEDLDRMPLMLSDLEYKNRTLSWLELLLAIKKDVIKMLLANAPTLVREKFGRKKKPELAVGEAVQSTLSLVLPRISVTVADAEEEGSDGTTNGKTRKEESAQQTTLSRSQTKSTPIPLDAMKWTRDDVRKRKLLGLFV